MAKLQKIAIVVYRDKLGEFRWRAVFRTKVLADSGEGYKRRTGLDKALERLFRKGYTAVYDVIDRG